MTRIEKAIEKIMINTIKRNCPSEFIRGEIFMDDDSAMEDNDHNIIGCRGITCEQCWNAEYKEVQDDKV